MNSKIESRFVGRRTEAVTLVMLSSRSDLTVMNAPEHSGVDLIVSIDKKRVHAFNHFGLILKGTSQELRTVASANRMLKSLTTKTTNHASLSMPICIFLFSMVGDQGFYSWLLEPATSDGLPRLHQHTSLDCKRLDQSSLQSIVDDVNAYFDSLSKVLVS